MQGLNASFVKYIQALSPGLMNSVGSTNPSNLAGFEYATLLVSVGSGGSASTRLVFNIDRSATSNGTFAQIGASLSVSAGSSLHIRSFTLDSSATWYRVSYENSNNGSFNATAVLQLQRARTAPVNQDDRSTVYSDIIGA